MSYYHTTITKDNKCVDLLLTEDEIANAFARAINPDNKSDIDYNICCSCWDTSKPPECSFWRKILGMCYDCKN